MSISHDPNEGSGQPTLVFSRLRSDTSSPASITHEALESSDARRDASVEASATCSAVAPPATIRQSQVIPSFMRDFAVSYPFVTVAALGASAGAVFAFSAMLTRTALMRLGRKSRLSRDVDVATSRIFNSVVDLERRLGTQLSSNESSLRKEIGELRRLLSISSGQSLGPSLSARHERLSSLPDHTQQRLAALPASSTYWDQLRLNLRGLRESVTHLTDTVESNTATVRRAVSEPIVHPNSLDHEKHPVVEAGFAKGLDGNPTKSKSETPASPPESSEPVFRLDQIDGAMKALRHKHTSGSGGTGDALPNMNRESITFVNDPAADHAATSTHEEQQPAQSQTPSPLPETSGQQQTSIDYQTHPTALSPRKGTQSAKPSPLGSCWHETPGADTAAAQEPTPTQEPSPKQEPSPTHAPPARVRGVDDSGSWSFRLLHSRTPYRAGSWSEQSIILSSKHYRESSNQLGRGGWTTYSHSSYGAFATTAKVFVTSSVDLIQLDGFVWRCERDEATGNFVIVKKLYAA